MTMGNATRMLAACIVAGAVLLAASSPRSEDARGAVQGVVSDAAGNPSPFGLVDKKNNFIWVSEHQVDKIARFDPKTEEWVEFPLPEAESDPRRIDIDPTNPNRIYFSGNTPGRMGFVEVLAL